MLLSNKFCDLVNVLSDLGLIFEHISFPSYYVYLCLAIKGTWDQVLKASLATFTASLNSSWVVSGTLRMTS